MRSRRGNESTQNGSLSGRERALRMLEDLKARFSRRLPDWGRRGPEDPAWVLLEVFAEALAEIQEEAEEIEERLYPRLLESLGEEPRWAQAARGAVVFHAVEGTREALPIPRGVVVSARRLPDEPGLSFETITDAWTSSARLLRVAALCGERHQEMIPYPHKGWDASSVKLFGERAGPARYLYLGDPALFFLRASRGTLILEWPGAPAAVAEGRWEYSVPGGWRGARLEAEECRSATGKRALRLRLRGPLLAIAEERLEGMASPWLRLAFEGERRLSLRQPQWIALELEGGASRLELKSAPEAAALVSFPRPVARLLSFGGERWEDHSLAREKFQPAPSSAAWDPALYLGWDAPVSASVYLELATAAAPSGGHRGSGNDALRLVWEYSTGRVFRALELNDGTAGLTRSGCLAWNSPPGWQSQEVLGERLHWLRARWVGGSYGRPPEVRAVLPHAAEVRQGKTLKNCILESVLDRAGKGLLDLSFDGGGPERFSVVELKVEGRDWQRLDHFKLRRWPRGDFLLDAGAAWTGKVRVKIPHLRVGLGSRGNAPPGTLRVLEDDLPGIQRLEQPLALDGGADAESAAAFRERIRSEWRTGNRAVTREDFLRLCRAFAPEVGRVEVERDLERPERLAVTLVLEGAGGERPGPAARLSPALARRLEDELGERVPLGTVVEVAEAVFLPVEIVMRGAEGARLPAEGTRRFLEAELRGYLHPLRGGIDGRGFPVLDWWREETLGGILTQVLSRAPTLPQAPVGAPGLDPGAWRSSVSLSGGVVLPDLATCGPGGTPVVFPLLERLVFEPLEGRSPA